MDGAGQHCPPPGSVSDPSNPTSPVESYADHPTHESSHLAHGQNTTSHDGISPRPHSHPAYPGASVYTPTDTPSERLNPRSCVTCRRRKVRCDKHMPCSNCRRAQIPCIFPAPGRAPRRPRPKDPNAPPKQPSSEREIELMKRLRKLEGIVEELSGQIEVETARHNSSTGNSPEGNVHHVSDTHTPGSIHRVDRADSILPGSSHGQGSPLAHSDGRPSPFNFGTGPGSRLQRTDSMNNKFGRLVVNDHGKTRYVSSVFWSKITDELDEIRNETRRLTDGESDESDDESIIASSNNQLEVDHHAFLLGYRSADVDLRPLHPLPSQIPYMWQLYKENVDPIVKVIHVPSVDKLIKEARKNLDNLTPANEALMFAIYFAAIHSMDETEVKPNFGVERDKLITQYRFALEQALAKANFVATSELVVLQAFLLYLVLIRRHDDTRFCWSLTGLAIRIGQSMGIHRDGTYLPGLTPLEIEMRRRLFWGLCILDLRSAEDQGTELTITDKMFDTELPLNINDSDLSEETKELPQPRQGVTDMTFSLIRYEVCASARRLYMCSATSPATCTQEAAISMEERESMVRLIYRDVEEKYFKDASTSCNAQLWTAANIARVIVAKMTLVVYQPVLLPGPDGQLLSEEIRQRIITAATEIFEYNHQLNSDPRSRQWKWLFQTYTQWHAVAYVLLEVGRRPWSAAMERAWAALNSVLASPSPQDLDRIAGHTSVWLPLKKIFLKAKKHREAEISRLKANPDAAQQLEIQERSQAPLPLSFAAMPGSVKSAIAMERWRKLVNAPPLPAEMLQQPSQAQSLISATANSVQAHSGSEMNMPQESESVEIKGPPLRPDIQDPRMMNLVEASLSQSAFMPESLWPIAFAAEYQDMARSSTTTMGGFPLMGSSSDIPRQDATLSNYVQQNNPSSNNTSTSGSNQHAPSTTPGMASGMEATPLLDALKVEGNLPSWMWTAPPASTPATSNTFGATPPAGPSNGGGGSMTTPTPNGGGAQGLGSFGFPLVETPGDAIHAEDIDMDMNEDFNWADWGQTLMESGSNIGGVWSAHGM
ncbi:fungal-specific transcription factor domain-domain-containing protein [Coniella lustricola]|uniref:Fungal-specific transcription factor domain-domain-containing protein n=1 Tax=Coniella lustricola TaxID=2025994 RepID=A0A2T3AGG7_9PEZI|nr:fungal-specific transcription factor domain-domain-containing protein [Coniella lustricola]